MVTIDYIFFINIGLDFKGLGISVKLHFIWGGGVCDNYHRYRLLVVI